MRITLTGNTQQHLAQLGLTFPFTEEDLKRQYRELAKEHHPDKGAKDANTFMKIQSAYEYLQAYAYVEGEGMKEVKDSNPEDIFTDILKEKCPHCSGGKTLVTRIMNHWNNCEKCNDPDKRREDIMWNSIPIGSIPTLCKKCDKGKYKLKSGRIVDCNSCNGTGVHKLQTCSKCGGRGQYISTTQVQYWEDCHYCGGRGWTKLDVFNPVIPQGAILR